MARELLNWAILLAITGVSYRGCQCLGFLYLRHCVPPCMCCCEFSTHSQEEQKVLVLRERLEQLGVDVETLLESITPEDEGDEDLQ
jgi:hypothetical protein